jgi:hypothetical protein
MTRTFRAQIIWDFEFEENGYTESEQEYLESELEEGETLEPRTEEQMKNYAHSELLDALYNSIKYNDLYQMIDVVEVNEE